MKSVRLPKCGWEMGPEIRRFLRAGGPRDVMVLGEPAMFDRRYRRRRNMAATAKSAPPIKPGKNPARTARAGYCGPFDSADIVSVVVGFEPDSKATGGLVDVVVGAPADEVERDGVSSVSLSILHVPD
jgi:hypothetical protein